MLRPPSSAANGVPRSILSQPIKLNTLKYLHIEFRALLGGVLHERYRAANRSVASAPMLTVGGELGAPFPVPSAGRRHPGLEAATPGEALDPLMASLAGAARMQLVPSMAPALVSGAAAFPSLGVTDPAALEEVVRRVAWGGDRRRGIARIELGGEHLGTAIVVRGEGREISLSIEAGRSADALVLGERLGERLRARGLALTRIEFG